MPKAATVEKVKPEIPNELKEQRAIVMRGTLPPKLATQPEYDRASKFLAQIVSFRRQWLDYWKPKVGKAKELYDLLREARDEVDHPAKTREEQLRSLIGDFDQEKRAEEARLNAKRIADAEAREKEKRDAEIASAQKMGAPPEVVAAMKEEPIAITAPAPVEAYKRAEGQSSYEAWEGVCDSVYLLACHIAGVRNVDGKRELVEPHPEDCHLIEARLPAINERARSQKELFSLPGCRAQKKTIVRQARW